MKQGTKSAAVPETLCKGIVAGGVFIAWDEKRQGRTIRDAEAHSPL